MVGKDDIRNPLLWTHVRQALRLVAECSWCICLSRAGWLAWSVWRPPLSSISRLLYHKKAIHSVEGRQEHGTNNKLGYPRLTKLSSICAMQGSWWDTVCQVPLLVSLCCSCLLPKQDGRASRVKSLKWLFLFFQRTGMDSAKLTQRINWRNCSPASRRTRGGSTSAAGTGCGSRTASSAGRTTTASGSRGGSSAIGRTSHCHRR